MNHFLINGLLSLLMIGQAPVEPICLSIDKYQTPDKEFNLYFFGDYHIGHPKFLTQERIDFINAAKKKDAFVIAEDMTHYNGWNQKVKQASRTDFRSEPTDHIQEDNSALEDLYYECDRYSIPFFNAECRHEIVYYEELDEKLYQLALNNLIEKAATILLQAKYNNWLADYCSTYFQVNQTQHQHTTSVSLCKHLSATEDFRSKAVDIHILHALHDLTQSQNKMQKPPMLIPNEQKNRWLANSIVNHKNTKNIFIFAGIKHIERVIAILGKYLLNTQNTTNYQKQFALGRLGEKKLIYDEIKYLPYNNKALDQNSAQRFIDKYSVNSANFFSLEKQHEQANLRETQNPRSNSDSESWEKITESNAAHAAILLKLYAIITQKF